MFYNTNLNILLLIFIVIQIIFTTTAVPIPQNPTESSVHILSYINDNNDPPNYNFSYELTDGQRFSQTGSIKNITNNDNNSENNKNVAIIIVTGEYSFVGSDGETYYVQYTADENGYHPIISNGVSTFNLDQAPPPVGIDANALKSLIG